MHLKALEALYFWPFVVSAAVGNSSFSAFLTMLAISLFHNFRVRFAGDDGDLLDLRVIVDVLRERARSYIIGSIFSVHPLNAGCALPLIFL